MYRSEYNLDPALGTTGQAMGPAGTGRQSSLPGANEVLTLSGESQAVVEGEDDSCPLKYAVLR